MITSKLEKFGSLERDIAVYILDAITSQGYPKDFEPEDVKIRFNQNTGLVFLSNRYDQMCAVNRGDDDDTLELYYITPDQGYEGFLDDLVNQVDNDWSEEDIDYLTSLDEITDDQIELIERNWRG